MPVPLAAFAIGTGLSALTQWLSGRNASDASTRAAEAQAAAAAYGSDLAFKANEQNTALQFGALEQQQINQQPWLDTGKRSLADLGNLVFSNGEDVQGYPTPAAFDPSTVSMDPGFDFRLREGQKALERAAAAKGGALGGNTLRKVAQFGQDYASAEYDKAYGRAAAAHQTDFVNKYNVFSANQANRFNRLATLANVGQIATNQLGQAQQTYANNVGQAGMQTAAQQGELAAQGANARASGYVGSANAYQTVPQTIASLFGAYAGSRR